MNRSGVMHLVTVSGFAATLPKPRRVGSEALGSRPKNGHVEMSDRGQGAPSPSLGASSSLRPLHIDFLYDRARCSSACSSMHSMRTRLDFHASATQGVVSPELDADMGANNFS